MTKRSRIRSMKTVPKVRESETGAFDFRRYARYTLPSLAGTRQLTSQDRKMMCVPSTVRTGSRPAQEQDPPVAAQREADVVDEEGREQEPHVRVEDRREELLEVDREDDPEDEDEEDEREDERDDRPRLSEPAREGDLIRGDLALEPGGRLEQLLLEAERALELVVVAVAARRRAADLSAGGTCPPGSRGPVIGPPRVSGAARDRGSLGRLGAAAGAVACSTRRTPRARWTTFAMGVTRRTKYVARPVSRWAPGSAASRPAGVDGSTSTTVDATPTSRIVCASETETPGSPCSAAKAAAFSFPSPIMTRALCVST